MGPRLIVDNLRDLMCQALGWVFSHFPPEYLEPRSALGVGRAVVCGLGGWAKEWMPCKGLVSLFSSMLPELSLFLHRAQVHTLGLRFLFCALPTFVLIGGYVAMQCWSQRPTRPSR